ncbi:MAG TPA: hypothetical protein VHU40_15050 [Polyangia bacterium]|nr:hypothetical protein [Polyangia bacterium]
MTKTGRATLVLWCTLGGCAPSMVSLQPAHVAPKGSLTVAAGLEIGVPTGRIVDVVDTGETLAKSCANGSCQLTDDQKRQIFDAGVNLASNPPSVGQHLAVNYSVADDTELGLRWAGQNWRLGARRQLLHHQDAAFDLVAGLGVARGTTSIPLSDVLPVLKIDDFTRWTFDLPVMLGTSRDWFRVWGGVKLVYSRFDTRMHLELDTQDRTVASFEGKALYVLGQGGLAIGYRKVFLAVELTMGEGSGSATANIPELAGAMRTTDISGFVVYPAFALLGEF